PNSKRKRSTEGIGPSSTNHSESSRLTGLVISTNDIQPPNLTGLDSAVSYQT
ncbi:unnamed protein product, partial [Closterium sp. Naga37s-1]